MKERRAACPLRTPDTPAASRPLPRQAITRTHTCITNYRKYSNASRGNRIHNPILHCLLIIGKKINNLHSMLTSLLSSSSLSGTVKTQNVIEIRSSSSSSSSYLFICFFFRNVVKVYVVFLSIVSISNAISAADFSCTHYYNNSSSIRKFSGLA